MRAPRAVRLADPHERRNAPGPFGMQHDKRRQTQSGSCMGSGRWSAPRFEPGGMRAIVGGRSEDGSVGSAKGTLAGSSPTSLSRLCEQATYLVESWPSPGQAVASRNTSSSVAVPARTSPATRPLLITNIRLQRESSSGISEETSRTAAPLLANSATSW